MKIIGTHEMPRIGKKMLAAEAESS